jgi:hypothetical protein
MPRRSIATLLVSLVIAAPGLAAAQGSGKPDPKLPPAIEAAFNKAYPKATIKHVMQEKYGGKDAFEVESVDNGKTRDIVYHLDGSVAVVEEQIARADVPAPVLAAIKKDYPTATIASYERKMESGATSYEIQFKGAKAETAEYSPDGKRK